MKRIVGPGYVPLTHKAQVRVSTMDSKEGEGVLL